jgi:hypothetical protein
MYNVCCTWPFNSGLYVICHFWTPICNVLSYWLHHSICYASLFTTPLIVITIFGYNVLCPSDVLSRSGPLISSLLSVRWSLFSIFIPGSSLICCVLSSISLLYLGVSSVCCVLSSTSLLSLSVLSSFSVFLCQSQSDIATDGQSVSQ